MKNIINILLNGLDNYIQTKNLEILKKNLSKKIEIYIDVGSHNGEMIKTISEEFSIKKIFAFEPNPDCINNLKSLKKKNLKIFEMALSDKPGIAQLNIGHISSMSTINNLNYRSFYTKIKKFVIGLFFFKSSIYKNQIKVKKESLFNVLKNHNIKNIDLIKIDTEGHEFNVLNGLRNYIKRTNIILLEYHYDNSLIKNYDFQKINFFFTKNGFKLISKNKMLLRKGYEIIFKNLNNFKKD